MTRFQPGDKVRHTDLGVGRVLKCINNDDVEDRSVQGERYYVLVQGETWSVLSRHLFNTP